MKQNLSSNTAVRLKELRDTLSLTQDKMAEQMSVSKSAYQKYEQGMRFPAVSGLRRLAVELDVSMDWLLFDKGPMYYGGKRLNAELDELKNQLHDARQHMEAMKADHQQELRDQADRMSLEPDLKDLIEGMTDNAVIYHEVLAVFNRLKQENQGG